MAEFLINTNDELCYIYRQFLPATSTGGLYDSLLSLPYQQITIKARGRDYTLPRLVYIMADDNVGHHHFRDTSIPVHPWSPEIDELRQALCIALDQQWLPNSCTINYYPDGDYHIAAHSDSEVGTYQNTVLTLSLGESRRFTLRNKTSQKKIVTEVRDGDLFGMALACNEHWTHEIPKQRNKSARVSLTFRDMAISLSNRKLPNK